MSGAARQFGQKIQENLRAFRPLDAVAMTKQAYAHNPNEHLILETHASCLQTLGRLDQAASVLDQYSATFPDSFRPRMLLAKLELARGNLDASEDHLEQALVRGMERVTYCTRNAYIMNAYGDTYRELQYLLAARKLSDYSKTEPHFRYGYRALTAGYLNVAIDVSKQLSAHRPKDAMSRLLRAHILASQMRYDQLEKMATDWFASDKFLPKHAQFLYRIWIEVRQPAILDLVKRAVQKWPQSPIPRLLGLRHGFLAPAANAASILNRDERNLPPIIAAEEASLLAANGQFAEAKTLITTLEKKWPTGFDIEWDEEIGVLRDLPSDSDLKRPLIKDNPDADWIQSEAGPHKKLAIIFTGFNGSAFIPVHNFDRYLAALGYDAIYLRDPDGYTFLNGIRSERLDWAKLKTKLGALNASYGPERTTFIGISSGSYPATLMGLELGAKHIIQFGSVAEVGLENARLVGELRVNAYGIRLARDVDPHISRRLAQALHTAEGKTRIDSFYSAADPNDHKHTRKIRGFKNVHIWPITDSKRHNCLNPILSKGLLGPLLEKDFSKLGNALELDVPKHNN